VSRELSEKNCLYGYGSNIGFSKKKSTTLVTSEILGSYPFAYPGIFSEGEGTDQLHQWRNYGEGQVPPNNFLRDKGIILPPSPDNPTVQIAPFINELLWVLFNNIGA
jgi:hypothetical protein